MNKKTMISRIAILASKELKDSVMLRAMKQSKERVAKAYVLAQKSEKDAKFALSCLTGILYQ